MNRKELVSAVQNTLERTGCKITHRDVERTLDVFGDVAAAELLEGGDVPLPVLGKLRSVERAARAGRNPRTGESIAIPARRVVTFKAGKDLREALG